VFAVRDGRAVPQCVELGRSSALEAEVRAGLSEGEVVILHPGDKIQPGARVAAR
jgi:HlyD family secretion protein